MTDENEIDRPENFSRSILPWLLAGGMFIVYALTLEHWIAPDSLRRIASLSGLTWTPDISSPVYFLATYPIRWLPALRIPVVANMFSAVCAALTLALLARSVALLPHRRPKNRYNEEYEPNEPARHFAWLPPLLAAAVCGLQLSFWERATAAGSEMLDVLMFAYLIRCLLEYRADKKNSWLLRFAFVGGLAMADDWAMVAFFPGFLVVLLLVFGMTELLDEKFLAEVLAKRIKLVDARLCQRMLLCWLAGGSLFFLMPLMASHSAAGRMDFWPGLGYAIRTYYALLTAFPLRIAGLLCLTSVVPVFFMIASQKRVRGDWNREARRITRIVSQIVHGFFLAACLLTMLDAPVSPRHLQPLFACLPLYFLTALSIGYFSGFFLVAFEPESKRSRHYATVSTAQLSVASVAGISCLLLAMPWLLTYKNLPLIQQQRNAALNGYPGTLLKALPARGAVIMSEDATRLRWLEVALIRAGKASDYTLIDTALLTHFPGYLPYLDQQRPDFKLMASLTNRTAEITSPPVLTQWIQNLAHSHELYLMHPFVGYLAEVFYAQPRELLYQLRPYPTNLIVAPPMSPALIAENRAFWKDISDHHFPELLHHLEIQEPAGNNLFDRVLKFAHTQPEPNYGAVQTGNYYSLMLNGWGVELQRGGAFAEAGKCFETARRLNPDNNAALVNLTCNRKLQTHTPLVTEPDAKLEGLLGKHRDWDQSLRQDGPTDEPNACYRLGMLYGDARMFRQSLQQFLRAQTLVPDTTNAPARLADLYIELSDYPNALIEADYVLRLDRGNPRAMLVRGLALVQLGKPDQALPTLNEAVNQQTNDAGARLVRGLAYLKLNQLSAAQQDYDHVARATPNAYPAYYGLAEIAYRNRDKAAAIRNCELYLAKAPANSPDERQIRKWLEEMKTEGYP